MTIKFITELPANVRLIKKKKKLESFALNPYFSGKFIFKHEFVVLIKYRLMSYS